MVLVFGVEPAVQGGRLYRLQRLRSDFAGRGALGHHGDGVPLTQGDDAAGLAGGQVEDRGERRVQRLARNPAEVAAALLEALVGVQFPRQREEVRPVRQLLPYGSRLLPGVSGNQVEMHLLRHRRYPFAQKLGQARGQHVAAEQLAELAV